MTDEQASEEARRRYLDPDLWDVFGAIPGGRYSTAGLPAARQAMEQLAERVALLPTPTTVVRRDVLVPGLAGEPDVRVLLYEPIGVPTPRPAFLHFHGGGYVTGVAAMMAPDHYALAAELGCIVATVDYRLAPETAYPGQLNDGLAAFDWLIAQADRLGLDPQRTGIGGESAGGGIAAALALKLRDRASHQPSFLALTYPMLDDRSCIRPDPYPWTRFYTWSQVDNQFGWSAYLGGLEPGTAAVPIYAAPARATDLAGMPPTFLATGTLELFMREDLDFATRLLSAGVPVELHLYPGAFHGFERAPQARVTAQAARDRREALRRFCHG